MRGFEGVAPPRRHQFFEVGRQLEPPLVDSWQPTPPEKIPDYVSHLKDNFSLLRFNEELPGSLRTPKRQYVTS